VTLDGNGNIETCGEIDIDYVNGQKSIAEAKLNQLKVLYGESVSVHLQFGKVTDTIIQFAESNQYDLIVMGTKGVWGVKEKIASTEAQMVARRSNIPLLSLMCDRSDLVIKDILFVHDFMENDHTDIPLMQTFSKYFDAAYHMLYVHNDPSIDPQKVHENIRKHAEAHNLTTWYGHIVVAPDVETGVNEFLKTQDADMVFVGTHGKGGFFHKSAAESLIKHLFKPIITFHFNTK
jgi:nucleotide-binding universal stress UspA family protein